MRLILFSPGLGLVPLASLLKNLTTRVETHLVIDNKHNPYGSKSPPEVSVLVGEALSQLSLREDDLVVIACNTSSHALTLHPLRDIPCQIINLQEETLRALPTTFSHSHTVLLLGTKTTVSAGIYERGLREAGAACIPLALPTLAASIDAGDWAAVEDELEVHIPREVRFSHVLLACTHYPLALKYFQSVLNSRGSQEVPIVSQEGWLLRCVDSYIVRGSITGAAPCPMTVHLLRHSPFLFERLSVMLPGPQLAPLLDDFYESSPNYDRKQGEVK